MKVKALTPAGLLLGRAVQRHVPSTFTIVTQLPDIVAPATPVPENVGVVVVTTAPLTGESTTGLGETAASAGGAARATDDKAVAIAIKPATQTFVFWNMASRFRLGEIG
jgi:hypothetical protein